MHWLPAGDILALCRNLRSATMNFQIKGLPVAPFAPLFGRSDDELAAHNAVRMRADRQPGFPCRVSLEDAAPGETVLLLNYEHLAVATPYRSRYAIFVREGAVEARLDVNEIPPVLSTRLISARAFDEAGMLLDADVVQGTELASAIERMFSRDAVAYLHLHNAKPGCFAARVDRAWHAGAI
jgi:Protein of unknown function (DUF1203)